MASDDVMGRRHFEGFVGHRVHIASEFHELMAHDAALRERIEQLEGALGDVEVAARNCRTTNIDRPRDCFAAIEEVARRALESDHGEQE